MEKMEEAMGSRRKGKDKVEEGRKEGRKEGRIKAN